MIRNYMIYRKNLMSVFVLIDIRISPQQKDLDFINWLGEKAIPFCLIFTKADKQTRTKNDSSVKQFCDQLYKTLATLPPQFISSAETKAGRAEILAYIDNTNLSFKK